MTNSQPPFHLEQNHCWFEIVNPSTSGATDAEVYVSIVGLNPKTNDNCYVDFNTGSLVDASSVFAQSGCSQSLEALKTAAAAIPAKSFHPLKLITDAKGNQNLSIYCPPIKSARIYFAVYDNMAASTANSGPSASKGENLMFDKIEFDTSTVGSYNINSTSVDFYGLSYTLSVVPTGGSSAVEVGYTKGRAEVIAALQAVPATTPATSNFGNTDIFKQTIVSNSDNIQRVLAPKNMALTDWGKPSSPYTNAQRASHFLDDYVSKHCYLPGRTFSFYSKLYPSSQTVYYGEVDTAGENIKLYTDAARTQAYSPCPTLPKPTNAFGNPNFGASPSQFHNVNGANDTIDWGFLLMGNSAGTGAGANWGSDPLAIAIMVSICRGVMHLDDGTSSWIDSSKYYQGGRYTRETNGTTKDNGASAAVTSPEYPVYFYSKVLHEKGFDGKAYALSYDDVYGSNPSVYFDEGTTLTVNLNSLHKVAPSS